MKKILMIFAAILMSASVFAQSLGITLTPEQIDRLDPTTKAQIVALQTEQKSDQIIATGSKWVGLGKEIGSAMNESLTAITTTAANFADTKLGRFTMILVAYKVIGTELLQIAFGILWLIILIWVSIYLYKNNCDRAILTSRIWNKEARKFDKTYKFESADEEWKVAAIVIFCVGFIFTPLIIFV